MPQSTLTSNSGGKPDLIKEKEMGLPTKLIYKDVKGAGKQIFAELDSEYNMAEFTKLKGTHIIATEPWIQFEPKEWSDMMDHVFSEMVDAYNERHSR